MCLEESLWKYSELKYKDIIKVPGMDKTFN